MDLQTATPRQIDTRAAELDGTFLKLKAQIAKHLDTLHRSAEKPRQFRGNKPVWTLTDAEAVTAAQAKVAEGVKPWDLDPTRALTGLEQAERELAENRAEAEAIETEYARRPWTRYVSVAGGHVHSGIWCAGGTIRYNTIRNWAPDLSGLEVAEAVAKLGPLLCTHCFPSAPVEWKAGAKAETEHCAGSGKQPVEGTFRHRGATGYGKCPSCPAMPNTTQYGYLRKHKPAA